MLKITTKNSYGVPIMGRHRKGLDISPELLKVLSRSDVKVSVSFTKIERGNYKIHFLIEWSVLHTGLKLGVTENGIFQNIIVSVSPNTHTGRVKIIGKLEERFPKQVVEGNRLTAP